MFRGFMLVVVLCTATLLALTPGVQATGLVTFQVEVMHGFRVSSPGTLVFAPVAPEQSNIQELELTVWSNVEWDLSVKAIGYDPEGGLQGTVEVGNSGAWHVLSTESNLIQVGQSPTGVAGATLLVPFRIKGSYDDAPGAYSFQVEFTVAPAI